MLGGSLHLSQSCPDHFLWESLGLKRGSKLVKYAGSRNADLRPLAPQICNAVILVLVSVIKQIKLGRRQDEIYMYMCNHKYLCTDISFLAVPCLQCSHVKLSEKELPDINWARIPVEPTPEHRFLRTPSHLPFPPLPTLNGRGPISLALASMHPQGRRSSNISSKRI